MLHNALQLAQGLGPRVDRRPPEQKAADQAAGRLGDDVVGAARLGLWCGTQLLGKYILLVALALVLVTDRTWVGPL